MKRHTLYSKPVHKPHGDDSAAYDPPRGASDLEPALHAPSLAHNLASRLIRAHPFLVLITIALLAAAGSVALDRGFSVPGSIVTQDDIDRAVRSAREALFSDGLAIVARLTGKSEGQSRSIVGGWLRALDDDCAALMAKLREAESRNPADPMAWISAACRPRGGGGEQRMSALGQRLVGLGMPVGDFVQDAEGVNE